MADDRLITVARGDGIGPEIMDAVLAIIEVSGARLEIEEIEVGEKLYRRGNSSGIDPQAWESLERSKVFLKAPITTPQGEGVKSLNVTIRKAFGLYANVRPAISYHPYVDTKHPRMNVVVVRENEEGLYAGIEYAYSEQVMSSYKMVTEGGCQRIIRFAFEFAQKNGRRRLTCLSKDNILKISDGIFHKTFDQIAPEYPDIEADHWIVDIGCAKLADTPEKFDVVVTPNLYGDIISDMTAQISGSVGIVGSANIGNGYAMFEAIHGSAPRRAGQNLANPSGLLLGAILMLAYIDQANAANRIHNAWLKTIEDGEHTYDIFRPESSKRKVGTKEFAKAVVARMGEGPHTLQQAKYRGWQSMRLQSPDPGPPRPTTLVGIDVFIQNGTLSASQLGEQIQKQLPPRWRLDLIGNRGTRIWPEGRAQAYLSDIWQCRFRGDTLRAPDILTLLSSLVEAQFEIRSFVTLLHIDGQRAYALLQGE